MAEKLTFELIAKDKFGKVMKGLKTSMLAGAVAVAAVGTALTAIAIKTAKADDEVGKFSDRIGVSTEALSEWQYVAELSGVEANVLNKSWQNMTKNVQDAAGGIGEAKDALEGLGIEAGDIASLGIDEQFEVITASLADVTDESQRVAMAFDIFGGRGVGVLQMLKNGTEGMEAMRLEAIKLGIVVSEGQAASAAIFNDSMTAMGHSMRGVSRGIGQEIMPALATGMQMFTDFVVNNREAILAWASKGMTAFGDFARTWLIGTAQIIDFAVSSWDDFFLTMNGMWLDAKSVAFDVFDDWLVGIRAVVDAINFGGKLDEELASIDNFRAGVSDSMAQINAEMQGNSAALVDAMAQDSTAAQDTIDALLVTYDEGMAKIKETIDAANEGDGDEKVDPNIPDPVATQAQIDTLNELYAEQTETDRERLEAWYEESQGLHRNNADELSKVDALYAKKDKALRDADNKSRLDGAKGMQNNLLAASKAYGKTAFEAYKATAIATTVIDTYKGAQQAFTSLSSIPIIGTVLGIAAAAAAIGAGMARVSSIRSSTAGAAHGGLTNVPAEQTYLLDEGERVLSPNQNTDLTSFLNEQGGAGGGGVTIKLDVLPNATNFEALHDMDEADWILLVEDNIFPAMRQLQAGGVTA